MTGGDKSGGDVGGQEDWNDLDGVHKGKMESFETVSTILKFSAILDIKVETSAEAANTFDGDDFFEISLLVPWFCRQLFLFMQQNSFRVVLNYKGLNK